MERDGLAHRKRRTELPETHIRAGLMVSILGARPAIQRGPDARDLVNMMGSTIGRSMLFGIPLQQQWFYGSTGSRPTRL